MGNLIQVGAVGELVNGSMKEVMTIAIKKEQK